MRTTWVLGAIAVSVLTVTPVGAAPVEPTWPLGPMYNYAADCTGVTTDTIRWPDSATGTITINDEVSAIPLNTTAFFPSDGGDYLFTLSFAVPGQVPLSEYQHVYCRAPVEVDAAELSLPATL